MKYVQFLCVVLLFGLLGCSKRNDETPQKRSINNWKMYVPSSDGFSLFSNTHFFVNPVGSYLKLHKGINGFGVFDPVNRRLVTNQNVLYQYLEVLYGHSDGHIYGIDSNGNKEVYECLDLSRYDHITYHGKRAYYTDNGIIYYFDLESKSKEQIELPNLNGSITILGDVAYSEDKIIIRSFQSDQWWSTFVEYDLNSGEFVNLIEFGEEKKFLGMSRGNLYLRDEHNNIVMYNRVTSSLTNEIAQDYVNFFVFDDVIVVRISTEQYLVYDLDLNDLGKFNCAQNETFTTHKGKVYISNLVEDNIEIRELDLDTGNSSLYVRSSRKVGSYYITRIMKLIWFEDQNSFVLDMRDSNKTQIISSYSF